MEQLKTSHDVEVVWRSYELRPKDSAPISPEYRARIEAGRPRLYAIAKERYGLDLRPGPFGIDSRPALIGAKYAEQNGAGKRYHELTMSSYWLEEQDISKVSVLANIAEEVGLDREEFLDALQQSEYANAVASDINEARMYGLNAVPALVFNMKFLVSGAQPYEALVNVVEQIHANDKNESTGNSDS